MISPKMPAKIVPIQLEDFNEKTLILQKGAFLCGDSNVQLDVYAINKFGVGMFAGEGFILQKASVEESGTLLLKASGCIYKRYLRENESIKLSVGMLVGMEQTVT